MNERSRAPFARHQNQSISSKSRTSRRMEIELKEFDKPVIDIEGSRQSKLLISTELDEDKNGPLLHSEEKTTHHEADIH